MLDTVSYMPPSVGGCKGPGPFGPLQSHFSEHLRKEVEAELGFLPPFFGPALANPAIFQNLWDQTRALYLQNPLPTLFKEKLLAYTSRFCTKPYSLIVHACKLFEMGQSSSSIYQLLNTTPPQNDESFEIFLLKLNSLTGPFSDWPQDEDTEEAIFWCSISLFLKQGDISNVIRAVQRVLPGYLFQSLTMLISYSRTCQFWLETNPDEISYTLDQRVIYNLSTLIESYPLLSQILNLDGNTLPLSPSLPRPDDTLRNEEFEKQEEKLQLLSSAKDAAESASKAKTLFLAMMSHEIRTPLNGICASASLLHSTELNEEQKGYIASIVESGDLLLSVVNDLLSFSQIEQDSVPIHKTIFSLTHCLNEVATCHRAQLMRKNLPLYFRVDKDVPDTLEQDPFRLRQILHNLISNAIKFTQSGSIEVLISVISDLNVDSFTDSDTASDSDFSTDTDSDGLEFELNPNLPLKKYSRPNKRFRSEVIKELYKDHEPGEKLILRFDVKDSGIGIEEGKRESLFLPFKQGHPTDRIEGTGLGLAISRRIAEKLGGKLWISSGTRGHGTTFSFTAVFNKISVPALPLIPQELVPLQNAKPVRILVVDDNKINVSVLTGLLKKLGFVEILVATNGLEAVELARNLNPDIILMDVYMPLMDGFEATKQIISNYEARPDSFHHQPVVIAVSASAFAEDESKCLQAGMSDFLSKPLSLKKLAELMTKWTSCSVPVYRP